MEYNPARRKVEAGGSVLGTWVFSRDPAVVETAGSAGFDFVAIDMEHTALSWETVEDHVRSAERCGMSAFVRIGSGTPEQVTRALDIGAHGVCVPHITRSAARDLGPAFRYQDGTRGTCTAARAALRSWPDFEQYRQASDAGTWFIGLVEDAATLDDIDGLLADEQLDVVLPGRADLSASFGLAGQLRHPKVEAAIEKITSAAIAAGVHAAGYVTDPADLPKTLAGGASVLFYSIDLRLMQERFAAIAQEFAAASTQPRR